MSKEARFSNSMYCFLPTKVHGFGSLAELALDMRWPLPVELVGQRTKQGGRS